MFKINSALDLFKPNKYGLADPIYPESWKKFGKQGKLWGVLTHYSMIVAVAILCIIAAIIRANN